MNKLYEGVIPRGVPREAFRHTGPIGPGMLVRMRLMHSCDRFVHESFYYFNKEYRFMKKTYTQSAE